MAEWRLFEGDVPYVSTPEFHADRERAPHLEQQWHTGRLVMAAGFVREAAAGMQPPVTVSDLGCGDGGLLSLLNGDDGLLAWGYDFQPSNRAGWEERKVRAFPMDAFGQHRDYVSVGEVVVMTETLEHLADPHGVLAWARGRGRALVCSSPFNENDRVHDACHAWAWDQEGYAAMIQAAGWRIVRHQTTELFQVVMAK